MESTARFAAFASPTVRDAPFSTLKVVLAVRYMKPPAVALGAKVAVPNDPSNENRALLLLQSKGIIKLRAGAGANGHNATPLDVAANPKRLKLVELDAAQLPRVLSDVDAAVINTNYALPAGLHPTRDAIALESIHSPYANVIVVRAQDRNKPWVKKLVAAYQSPQVRQFMQNQFKGAMLPAF